MTRSLKLGVNVDHVATLRQARGTIYPDPLEAAILCARAGANSITIHLREDRRHIQDADVYRFSKNCPLPINLEMANVEKIIQIALDIKPAEICLVPEKRQELTTEGGLDVLRHIKSLEKNIKRLQNNGSEVSLFIEPNEKIIQTSANAGVHIIELHTGIFCDASSKKEAHELLRELIAGAEYAHSLGLQVNAGHGINLHTLPDILKIPHLDTLNIGHSLISRAVFHGLENTVREMISAMESPRQ